MTLALALSGVGLVLLPGCARPLGRRLRPAEWATLCAVLLGVGAAALELALLAVGATTVLHVTGLDDLAGLCERILGTAWPGGAPAGLLAAAAAAAVAVAALGIREAVRVRRTRRAVRFAPELGRRVPADGYDVVVLPSQRPLAFAVPSQPRQVVISDGLVDALAEEELAAVLRHEAAHLRHRHHRHLLLVTVIERALGVVPLVGRSTSALRCALERWADEDAAIADGDRASVRSALLRVSEVMVAGEVAAFVTVATVAERLEALQAPPLRRVPAGRRVLVYAPAALLLVAMAVSLTGLVEHMAVVHLLAGLCPLG